MSKYNSTKTHITTTTTDTDGNENAPATNNKVFVHGVDDEYEAQLQLQAQINGIDDTQQKELNTHELMDGIDGGDEDVRAHVSLSLDNLLGTEANV